MFDVALVHARACSGHVRAAVFLFASLHVAGCARAATSAKYQPLTPDQPRSAATSRSGVERGQGQGSEFVLRGSVLQRERYVRAVLESNPTIESARQGWRAAIARAEQAGAWDDPMLEVAAAPLSIGSSKAPLGYEVGIRQQLPWFGKRSLDASVSAAEADAAKSDYESVRRELALTALDLYDQYFVAQRSLEINAAHLELMSAMRASAVAQFGSGRGSAQDSLQAEAELAHMEHDALVLASQREIVVAQMNELLHRAPELPLPPPPAQLPAPGLIDTPAQVLESEALEKRPDIAAARQHVRAEQARIDRADREAYPDLTVSTSYNSMWDMPEHRWMVGVAVNLPIWAGKRSAMAEEARATRTRFESEIARMTDLARTQVFVSIKRLQESEHVLRLFEGRLLPVARAQIDAARAGFVTSQNPFMAVVAAEKNLRQVELDYQVARADYGHRRGELDRALGRIPGLDWQDGER